MTAQEWGFLVIATVGSISAFRVVTGRNVVHAALYLVVTLGMVAATYLLVGAEFVGWVQVLIYVGAVIVLVLFALMLTRAPIGRQALDNQQRLVAAIVGLGVLAGLVFLIHGAFPGVRVDTAPTTTAEVGASLFSRYVLPFEVVSFLLLAALIGAIVIAQKDEGDTP